MTLQFNWKKMKFFTMMMIRRIWNSDQVIATWKSCTILRVVPWMHIMWNSSNNCKLQIELVWPRSGSPVNVTDVRSVGKFWNGTRNWTFKVSSNRIFLDSKGHITVSNKAYIGSSQDDPRNKCILWRFNCKLNYIPTKKKVRCDTVNTKHHNPTPTNTTKGRCHKHL